MRKNKYTGSLLVLLFFMGIGSLCRAQTYDRIILIVADDLGARDLGTYGNDFIETPRLDEIAGSGQQVARAYSAAPICSPTRASILTGIAPARLGMTEHLRGEPPVPPRQRLVPPKNISMIPKDIPTIATMFKNKEHKTAIIGKWHLGGGTEGPSNYGYDYTYASSWPGLPNGFIHPFFGTGVFPELEADTGPGDYLTDALGDRARKYIADNAGEKYFLHLNFYSPHVPIQARADLLEKYEAKRALDPDREFPNVHYAAMVESIDQNVGKIIDQISANGESERTLIIFTSDHGGLDVEEVPAFALHTPPTDNGGLRGGKGYLYEGGVRIPWIINHELFKDGDEATIITTDLFNICAQLINSEERTTDGQDISQINAFNQENPRTLFWHFPHYSPQMGRPESAILRGDDKLIRHYEGNYDELFTLEIGEIVNNAYTDEAKKEELAQLLDAWLGEVDAAPVEKNAEYAPNARPFDENFAPSGNANELALHSGGDGFYSQWNLLKGNGKARLENENILKLENNNSNALEYGRQLDIPISLRKNKEFWINLVIDSLVGNFQLGMSDLGRSTVWSLNNSQTQVNTTSLSLANRSSESISTDNTSKKEYWIQIISQSQKMDSVYLWTEIDASSIPRKSDAIISIGADVPSDSDLLESLFLRLDGEGSIDVHSVSGGTSFSSVSDDFIIPGFYDAIENFSYPPGESLNGNGISGENWSGSWVLQGNIADNISYIEEGSILIDNEMITSGNKYHVEYYSPGSRVRLDRRLLGPIISDGSTYWVSYISHVDEGDAANNVSNVSLVNSMEVGEKAMLLSLGRLYGNRKIGISTPADGQRKDVNKLDMGTHWIVSKIETYEDERPDKFYLWVDPASTDEPAVSSADVILESSVLINPADVIRIRTEGAGPNQTPIVKNFDELRLSSSWSEIVSMTEEVIPEMGQINIFPNPVSDQLSYTLDINKQATIEAFLLSESGDTIQTFQSRSLQQGQTTIVEKLNPSISSGYYFLHLKIDDYKSTRKIIIIK